MLKTHNLQSGDFDRNATCIGVGTKRRKYFPVNRMHFPTKVNYFPVSKTNNFFSMRSWCEDVELFYDVFDTISISLDAEIV